MTVVITRGGRVVARLVSQSARTMDAVPAEETMDALFERYSRRMGGKPFSHDNLYDRGEFGS